MSWILERMLVEQQQLAPDIATSDIVIAIPHRGNFSAAWVKAFYSLKIPFATPPAILYESGQPIDVSRNIACTKALQTRSKYLFFLDSDVILKPDTVEQLLAVKMPITSACYRSRGEPYHILANINNKPIESVDPTAQFIKVDQIGMGACLIDTRVLKSLGAKLNEWRCFVDHSHDTIGKEVALYDNKKAAANAYRCTICQKSLICRFFMSRNGMQNLNALSEDYWFCLQAKQQGYPIVIKPGVWVDHEIGAGGVVVGEKGLINPLSSVAEVN